MTYILALDQGTTSSRAIVFDHAGAVRSLVVVDSAAKSALEAARAH